MQEPENFQMDQSIKTRYGDYYFRPYEDRDEPGILRLWEAAFGQKLSPDIWRWKFHNNPFGRRMMVCFTGSGQPVALYSGIPYKANFNEREIDLIHLMDNMSHPEHRFAVSGRTGLYGLTVRHFVSMISGNKKAMVSFGFPGQRHFRLGELQFHYRKTDPGIAYLEGELVNLKYGKPSFLRKTELTERPGEIFNVLWQKLKNKYPFAVVRDARFIGWRYYSHPAFRYKVYLGKSIFGGINSWMVFRIDHEMATLADLLIPDVFSEASTLLTGAAEDLQRAGCTRVRTWLPAGHFSAKHLREAGLADGPEPLGIIPATVVYRPELQPEFIDKTLYYSMGDGDLI